MIRTYYKFSVLEPIEHIENYQKAIKGSEKWEIHHRLETHRYNKWTGHWEERDEYLPVEALKAAGLYDNVPAWQLIFISKKDHDKMHNSGKHNPAYGKNYWEMFDNNKQKAISKNISKNRKKTMITCLETGETKPLFEWKKLGYGKCREVCTGVRKSCGKLHFKFQEAYTSKNV